MGLSITPFLKDALSDLYFREICDQEGWAYISPKNSSYKENVLDFTKGPRKIHVKMHEQIVQEVRKSGAVFDYLVCKVGHKEYGGVAVVVSPLALFWVKTRNGKNFTDDQLDHMGKIRLPLVVFRIRNVLVSPAKVETKWETKSGMEWLNEIDDKREEAESDDDFL